MIVLINPSRLGNLPASPNPINKHPCKILKSACHPLRDYGDYSNNLDGEMGDGTMEKWRDGAMEKLGVNKHKSLAQFNNTVVPNCRFCKIFT